MKPIYDTIGTNYNLTRTADPYITSRLWHFLNPQPGGFYLDIGCGTGNYTIALAKKGLAITGVEPSGEMLKIANSCNTEMAWLAGSAENIPTDANSFDGVIATLTIHHWANLAHSFKEITRVLKPGGNFVIFTAMPEQMAGYWLNHYFPGMMKSSIIKMPALEEIDHALAGADFHISTTEKYSVQDDLQDLFLYSGKNRPELYLDGEIRKGISSFAAIASKAEVDAGLRQLRDDLASGEFEPIKKQYGNDNGDYIFITAECSKQ